MRPYLVNTTNSSTIQVLDGFLYNLIYAGDSFQAGKDCGNFMTWHYSIRALASVVLADSSLMSQTSRMIDSCIIYNIYNDGSSYDFYWRDALHYHVYNMQGWINIALQAPQVLSSLALELIEAGCNFLIPYYSGQIIHIEFVKSTVAFDIARKNAGIAAYQNAPWDNTQAIPLLQLARLTFPSVAAWAYIPYVPGPVYDIQFVLWGAWGAYFQASPLVYFFNLANLTSIPATTVPPVSYQGTFMGSQLLWGDLSSSQFSGDKNYVISTAITATLTNGTAVAVLDGSTPANTATGRLPTLLNIALCSVTTQNPNCTASAIQGLTVWAPLYKPTGNAGNEYNFVPWLQAYDLMRPYLVSTGTYTSVVAMLDNFTYSFIPALDSQYGSSSSPDMYRTERFLVRAFASVILANQTEINNSMILIERHAITNMFPDGTTYDYTYHDSLAWHLKTLGFWIQLAKQAPFVCSTNTLRLIETCTNFLQQFVNASVIHQEYKNSQTSSDNTNKALNLTWVNTTSYTYLAQADLLFPSVYAWDSSPPAISRSSLYSIQIWLWGTLRVYYAFRPVFGLAYNTSAGTTQATTTGVAYSSSTSAVQTTTPVIVIQPVVPQLIWGDLRSSSLASYASTVITAAKTYALTAGTAVAVIDGSTPSNAAISRLNFLFQIALCSWMTQDPTCTASAIQGLTVWVPLYRPTGNPVNEYNFLGWLQSYDLMRPYIAANASGNLSALDSFTYSFIPALDNYGGAVATDQYFTKKLVIRTFASMILSNQTEIANSMQMINNEAPLNIYPSGATFEFVKRDSLALHLTTMLAWVQIALQASKMCNTTTLRLIEAGTNFLQQFVNGSIAHQEYKLSTFSSDNTNKALGLMWVNTTSFTFLLQADILFPSVYAWDTTPPAISRSAFTLNYWTWGALRLYYAANPLFPGMTPPPPNTTDSNITINLLPRSTQLLWGNLTDPALNSQLQVVISNGRRYAQLPFQAIPVIYHNEILANDPRFIMTTPYIYNITKILSIAICARFANDTNCWNSAVQGFLVWATTYIPTGESINEQYFLDYIRAYDLMLPIIQNQSVIATVDNFLMQIIQAQDRAPYFDFNNHLSLQLSIRAYIAVVLQNQTLLTSFSAMLDLQVSENIFDNGFSYDMYERDALDYHQANTQWYLYFVIQTPWLANSRFLSRLEATLNYLQPFYNGSKGHIEFLHSTVSFDAARASIGLAQFSVNSFDPTGAITTLNLAVLVFPSVQKWGDPPYAPAPTNPQMVLYYTSLRKYFQQNPLNYSSQSYQFPSFNTVLLNLLPQNFSGLQWGFLSSPTAYNNSLWTVDTAHSISQLPFLAVTSITSANTNVRIVSQIRILTIVALCASVTQNPDCLQAAFQGVSVWAATYVPTGNSVLDFTVLPVIMAYDLIYDLLPLIPDATIDAQNQIETFLTQLITTSDSYYVSNTSPDNYRTKSLNIRLFCSLALGDPVQINLSILLIKAHAKLNLFPNGSSYDFNYRDAVAVHRVNLEAWINIVMYASSYLDQTTLSLVEASANFLKPFAQGVQVHQEYQFSQNPLDRSGQILNASWNPASANLVLFEADAIFPSVYNWTVNARLITRTALTTDSWLIEAHRVYFKAYPLYGPSISSSTTQTTTVTTSTPMPSTSTAAVTTSTPMPSTSTAAVTATVRTLGTSSSTSTTPALTTGAQSSAVAIWTSTNPPVVTTIAPAYVVVLSITLNIGLSAFQAVQQVFVQTIAAAAGVDPSQVTIAVIVLARRRLLDSGVGVNVTIGAPNQSSATSIASNLQNPQAVTQALSNNGIPGAVVTSSPQVLAYGQGTTAVAAPSAGTTSIQPSGGSGGGDVTSAATGGGGTTWNWNWKNSWKTNVMNVQTTESSDWKWGVVFVMFMGMIFTLTWFMTMYNRNPGGGYRLVDTSPPYAPYPMPNPQFYPNPQYYPTCPPYPNPPSYPNPPAYPNPQPYPNPPSYPNPQPPDPSSYEDPSDKQPYDAPSARPPYVNPQHTRPPHRGHHTHAVNATDSIATISFIPVIYSHEAKACPPDVAGAYHGHQGVSYCTCIGCKYGIHPVQNGQWLDALRRMNESKYTL